MTVFPDNKRSSPNVPLEELFSDFLPEVKEPLELLEDDELFAIVIGRDESSHRKNGLKGTLFLGLVCEINTGHFGKKILVDSLKPHKIFISGKTGSGKSYTLGVLAEELAEQNLGIGTIIVDPMGTFWSMKYETSMKKGDLLDNWGLSPRKYENIRIFVPSELRDRYNTGTFDDVFSIRPDFLTPEDWANTFGIDFFTSPQSGLIIEVINSLKEKTLRNNESGYSIKDIVDYIENSGKIQDSFQSSTIRAVKTRFEGSSQWGVFSTLGTPIHKLSRPNQVSVVDVSLLTDKTRALVVGILAKQILTERTRIARQTRIDSMTELENGSINEIEIPVTWLLVDEAHTLAPSRGKTAASEPLIEYAKRGRMPGCALVLATQQPSATSDEILSQIDILISHNLSFSKDILELKRRSPSKLPNDIGAEGFIRNLPIGSALISDQSTQSKRTFVARIRPRISPHGGSALSPISDEQITITPTEIEMLTETSYSKPEHETEKSIIEPITTQIKSIMSELDIPEYNIPNDIASDYLNRFMRFKILYKEVNINNSTVTVSTVSKNQLNKMVEVIKKFTSLETVHKKTLQIDGNPVVLLNKNSSDAAFSVINTKNSTVIAVMEPKGLK
ncbi:MAG: ATP-binding protein [Promethearchaeota archaeon]